MKKLIYFSMVIVSAIGCVETEFVDIDRIIIEPSIDTVRLFPEQTFEIEAIYINPQDEAEEVIFDWNTIDPEIAQVATAGKTITAVSPGITMLTVAARGVVNDDLVIVVTPDPEAAVSVEIIPPSNNSGGNGLLIDSVKTLIPRVINGSGDEIEDPEINWASNDISVATVDQMGNVTGVSTGQVSITAEKDGVISEGFIINVVSSENELASISLDNFDEIQRLGSTGTIMVIARTATGNSVEVSSFDFNSSNPDVISIDSQGNFEALSIGESSISVSSESITSQVINVSVIDPDIAVNISINAPSNIVTLNETLQLGFTATNGFSEEISPEVTWSSSNEEIVTVDQNGLVSGLGEGIATITVVTDNNIAASIAIMVEGSNSRVASFQGINGYRASGSAMLVRNIVGDIFLEIGEDFSVSAGPGLFLYVSNTSSGRITLSEGIQVIPDRLTSSGVIAGRSFNLTAINPNITLDSFSHVVIVCVPFGGITFGFAEFP